MNADDFTSFASRLLEDDGLSYFLSVNICDICGQENLLSDRSAIYPGLLCLK